MNDRTALKLYAFCAGWLIGLILAALYQTGGFK